MEQSLVIQVCFQHMQQLSLTAAAGAEFHFYLLFAMKIATTFKDFPEKFYICCQDIQYGI